MYPVHRKRNCILFLWSEVSPCYWLWHEKLLYKSMQANYVNETKTASIKSDSNEAFYWCGHSHQIELPSETVHPCEKVIGFFFQNQIWSRLSDINRLCLICIKISIEVQSTKYLSTVNTMGGTDETLKKTRCQFCDVKFGHQIMEVVALFIYKMRNFTQTTFNFTNR